MATGNRNTRDAKSERLKAAAEKYKFYSLAEIGPLLGLSHTTLYDYARAGKLKARKIAGKWRVLESDLDEFIKGNGGQK